MDETSNKVVFIEDKSGGFTAYLYDQPHVISQGETKEQALNDLKIAIELFNNFL